MDNPVKYFSRNINQSQVILVQGMEAEELAMLQALYSRSSASVKTHLKRVSEDRSVKFMEKYYCGYGHKSIADCGTTTLFFEGVSMLAAKAIQDTPLYNGQECSTRYIDFSNQKFADPLQTEMSGVVMYNWREFYKKALGPQTEFLMKVLPRGAADQNTWERACRARAFDVLRGFLPAGARTNLSWTGTLRQFADRLTLLIHHPLHEVKDLARQAWTLLAKLYPGSFQSNPQEKFTKQFLREWSMEYHQLITKNDNPNPNEVTIARHLGMLQEFTALDKQLMSQRPRHLPLPRNFLQHGNFSIEFALDFGSFRDIQRHRNGFCAIPQMSRFKFTLENFHYWYLDNLAPGLRAKADKLLLAQINRVKEVTRELLLDCDKPGITSTQQLQIYGARMPQLQYYIPMGQLVPVTLIYDLPQLVYVVELRSTKFVHPTLRRVILEIVYWLEKQYPYLNLYIDRSQSDWDVRRGRQTIMEKETDLEP